VTSSFRRGLAGSFEKLIREAMAKRHLQDQEAGFAATALLGALVEGLLGPLAPAAYDPALMRAKIQALTLFALRALGVTDARARGLVVHTAVPLED
jgi:hypothetical protein